MTPNVRSSPKPLLVYPILHRNSQCHSCSTVIPGDICFNCGRLSTLLVTPRPHRKPTDHYTPSTEGTASAQDRAVFQSRPFDSRQNRVRVSLAARERPTKPFFNQRAFDTQLTEIDDLLVARKKLTNTHTVVANDMVLLNDTDSSPSYCPFTCSSRQPFSNSSTAYSGSRSSSLSRTLRSESNAVSDILSEDGRPHARVVARWLENTKPSGKSSAKLTTRGVDCRLSFAGRIHEWVIFL